MSPQRQQVPQERGGRRSGREQIIGLMTSVFPAWWFTRWSVSLSRGWTPQRVVWVSVLMHWLPERTLRERFVRARQIVQQLHPRWKSPTSYSGFVPAQLRTRPLIERELKQRLRPSESWTASWQGQGWLLLAVDGTKFECPRTAANEQNLGCAGNDHSRPQVFQTTVLHLGSGVPWDFELGPGIESERRQLDRMLHALPENTLLVADAGFISFALCQALMKSGKSFVFRVAANMRLVEGLSQHCPGVTDPGFSAQQERDLTCLWPKEQHDHQPVLLRRVTVTRPSGPPVVLVTNVLDTESLPDAAIRDMYRQRWGLEIHYRTFKQTWHFATLNSHGSDTALCEQWWRFVSLWTLEHCAAQALVEHSLDPRDVSGAALRRIIRALLQAAETDSPSPLFHECVTHQTRDTSPRTHPRCRRIWPRKSAHKEPQPPKLRQTSAAEILRAMNLDSSTPHPPERR